MSIKAAADSGDNPAFISYRANVAEACENLRRFREDAAPRPTRGPAPALCARAFTRGRGPRFREKAAIRRSFGKFARTRRKQRESPAPRRAASERTPPPCVYGKARNAPNAQKSGTPARPACVDTLSAVSLYAPAEVTNILGSHVERPGNMMTSTSTMNMEVRKYGM